MQRVAAEAVHVGPEIRSIARRYHAAVAEQFGLRAKETI